MEKFMEIHESIINLRKELDNIIRETDILRIGLREGLARMQKIVMARDARMKIHTARLLLGSVDITKIEGTISPTWMTSFINDAVDIDDILVHEDSKFDEISQRCDIIANELEPRDTTALSLAFRINALTTEQNTMIKEQTSMLQQMRASVELVEEEFGHQIKDNNGDDVVDKFIKGTNKSFCDVSALHRMKAIKEEFDQQMNGKMTCDNAEECADKIWNRIHDDVGDCIHDAVGDCIHDDVGDDF